MSGQHHRLPRRCYLAVSRNRGRASNPAWRGRTDVPERGMPRARSGGYFGIGCIRFQTEERTPFAAGLRAIERGVRASK